MYLCPHCCKKTALKPALLCPDCQKLEDENLESEKQKRRQDRVAALRRAWDGDTEGWNGISPPKKCHGANWPTLPTALQEQIAPFMKDGADLLTFVGCPGAGKTWAAWATVGTFILTHGDSRYYNIPDRHIFTNWYAINQAARDSRLFGDVGDTNRAWMNKLAMAELVVIDEFATARPYEAEFMSVMAAIHHRFDNGKPTILITTKNEQELIELLGEAMVSRINSGIVVKMRGRDRRVKN